MNRALFSEVPRLLPFACALLLAGASVLSLRLHNPPEPLPADAPDEVFSAGRAFHHIEEIAQRPHPVGSAENARVRDYLMNTIRELGFEPVPHFAHFPNRIDNPDYRVSYAESILVRVPGEANSRAVMLMAHYDSVPYGPGAADDGSGVAVLMETLRALKHAPKLKNDVIFFFTDGEEGGLLGPKTFLSHPWRDDVGLVLNFEARGHYGPGYMYETSNENGWLIQEFAKAAPHPIANSFMFDVAGKMPTTTDYEVLKAAGFPGLNFAFIGGIKYYHTPNDSPEKLSLATLQHQGTYGLSCTLHFGNLDLREVRQPNAVYFNTIGSHLVHYPASWALPLAMGALLLFAFTILMGCRRRYLSIGGMLLGMGVLAVALLAAFLLVALLMLLAWFRFEEYVVYNSDLFFAGFAALTLCTTALIYTALHRRVAAADLAVGALLWWALALPALVVYSTGGSYIAQWPFSFATLGLLIVFLLPDRVSAAVRAGVLLVTALPAVFMLVPLLYSLSVAVTIVPAPFWMALLVFILGLAVPLMLLMSRPNIWWFPAAASATAAPLMLLSFFWFGYSKDYPKLNHLCYGMNCDTGEAFWISADDSLDEYTGLLMPDAGRGTVEDFRPGDTTSYWKGPAPIADLPEPELEILRDEVQEGRRVLEFKVKSPRHAERTEVTVQPGTPVYAARFEGFELSRAGRPIIGRKNEPWSMSYLGQPRDGILFELVTGTEAPLTLTVREQSSGVPYNLGLDVPPRPDWMITQPNTVRWWQRFRSNAAFTLKEFTL